MQRLRPEDDYFFRCESNDAPMHIGALPLYDAPEARGGSFYQAVCEQLQQRLPATSLSRIRRRAPREYDADIWCDVAHCDLSQHVDRVEQALDRRALLGLVEQLSMQRLDLERPPFHVHVIEHVEGIGRALFLRVHHSVTDGIGFQSLMALLTDATPDAQREAVPALTDEVPPDEDDWLAQSMQRFEREEREQPRIDSERARAKQALRAFEADPAHRRLRAPRIARTVPSSNRRRYETLDLPLSGVRAVARRLGGTVNDAFLTIVSGAIRRYLEGGGELPDAPMIAVGARSYRREEHGPFGNRIMNLMTSLASDLDDPAARFAEIRRASRVEIERSRLLEGLLREHDRPYGARDRRREFEETMQSGRRILPGQVVVSNVPGPAEPRYLAGHRLRASYPAPLLGYGRMLNVTLRRYLDELQLGIMSDPAMLDDVDSIRTLLVEAFEELETCAGVRG